MPSFRFHLADSLRRRRQTREQAEQLERDILAWQHEVGPDYEQAIFPLRWREDVHFSRALETIADMLGIDPPGVDMPPETARWLARHLHQQPVHLVARILLQAGAQPITHAPRLRWTPPALRPPR